MKPTLFTIPLIEHAVPSYGVMLMIGFLTAVYFSTRRTALLKGNPDLVLNAAFLALIFGVLGARVFYVIHHWERSFALQKNVFLAVIDVTQGGLEFYGGLIAGTLAVVLYLYLKGVSLRMYCDIIAPAIVWGLAFGRVGCFLNGCCWGGMCDHAWAVRFPHASGPQARQWLDRQLTLPAELLTVSSAGYAGPISRDVLDVDPESKPDSSVAHSAAAITRWYGLTSVELRDRAYGSRFRSNPVHPVQLYGTINAILLSFLLAAVLRRRKRHGVVFGLLLVLYPITRVILELVRVDNAHDVVGLTISQSVSVGMLTVAAVYFVWLYRQPLRSPKAVPFVFPEEPPPPRKKKRKRK